MNQITATIASLEIGEPTFCGGLTVFPLSSERRSGLDYLLLEEGLRKGRVSVREVSQGGSVLDLAVENRAVLPVLIVDGEELTGAKQNRVANLTILVPAGKTTIIPVSCVEAGRWSYDRPDFVVSDRIHYASGRAERVRSVNRSMRTDGSRRADQSQVWSSIQEKADAMSAPSETGAMGSIFERHAQALNDYVREVTAEPGQIGAILAVGDQHYGLDVFDRDGTLAAFLPKLVRSYGVDALERRTEGVRPVPVSGARDFLDRLREGSFDDHPAAGLGRDVGIVADGAIGSALVVDEVTLHLAAFADPPKGLLGHRRRAELCELPAEA